MYNPLCSFEYFKVKYIKFGLETTLHMQRSQPVIYFKVKSLQILYPHIRFFIILNLLVKYNS